MDNHHTGQLSRHFFFLQVTSMGLRTWDPNYTLVPRGEFFIILKNSHQDLSNEGPNFILSSLEVGH